MSQDLRCPACRRDLRAPPRPAHLAVLDDRGPPAPPSTPEAGNDSDGLSWMARLEAARQIAAGQPKPPARPLDLPGTRPAPTPSPLQGMPAHLLVAKLEQEESDRQREQVDRLQSMFDEAAPEEAIAKVQVDVTPAKETPRRLPEWLWVALVVALVVGGVAYAYLQAQREPKPVVQLDPAVAAAAERKKQALTALENGHQAMLDDNPNAAIRHYKAALKLEPTLASAERGLGIAYAAKGNRRAAIRHYRRFVKLEPDSFEAAKIKEIIKEYKKQRRRR